jgi:hypothetical protein
MRHISGEALRNGEVIAPTDVERELVHIVEQLEDGTAKLTEYSERLSQVSMDYEIQWARAMVRADGKSLDQRKAQVLLICEDLFRQKATLEGQVRLIRDCQHDLRAELEAVRSIGASVRSSMFEGGSPGSGSTSRGPNGSR